jgi:uncharacterized protein YeaO (DUF488 family)
MLIQYKRIYDYHHKKDDGYVTYIDKMYHRGLKRGDPRIKNWTKGLAPDINLMDKFHQNRDKGWPTFKKEYYHELEKNYRNDATFKMKVDNLIKKMKEHNAITLLYSSRDERYNNARVLARFLYHIYKRR